MKTKAIYHNEKQLQFLQAPQRIKAFVGGIGVGKTTVMGTESYRDVLALPQGNQFFLGLTFQAILKIQLRAIMKVWNKFGLIEHDEARKINGHFVIDRPPPKHWTKPFEPPQDYKYIISFCNGHNIQLLSLDRPELNRGSSFQSGKIDEAGQIPEAHFKNIIMGRLRGEKELFPTPRFRSLSFFTSMPFLSRGMWVLDYEEKAKKMPNKYFFLESTTFDNIAVLGQEYIDDLQENMDELTYQREVMNYRGILLPNAFYSELKEEVHIKTFFTYSDGESWKDLEVRDSDYTPELQLEVSLDFGGQANFATVWQFVQDKNEERCINNFWQKKPEIMDDLIQKICDAYRTHKRKVVNIWGDKWGSKVEANSKQTLFEQCAFIFKKNGWHTVIKYDGMDNPQHELKHFVINTLLRETQPHLPKVRFNAVKCKSTIISMKNAGILENFKKNKRSEHLLANREEATDLSDTVDYYLYFKLCNRVPRKSRVLKTSVR